MHILEKTKNSFSQKFRESKEIWENFRQIRWVQLVAKLGYCFYKYNNAAQENDVSKMLIRRIFS